jgi:hypothetical protein
VGCSLIKVRSVRNVVPVGMNKRIIWSRYYTPREFYGYFRSDFLLERYRGVCVFAPLPYTVSMRERHPVWYELPRHIDRRLAGWPLLRSIGDLF